MTENTYITVYVNQWDDDANRECNKPKFDDTCPFCGNNLLEMEMLYDVRGVGGVYYRLYCHDCFMAAPWSDTQLGAVRNWAKMMGRLK